MFRTSFDKQSLASEEQLKEVNEKHQSEIVKLKEQHYFDMQSMKADLNEKLENLLNEKQMQVNIGLYDYLWKDCSKNTIIIFDFKQNIYRHFLIWPVVFLSNICE